GWCGVGGWEHDGGIAVDEVTREEVELPGQLFDIEGCLVGKVHLRCELCSAALQQLDERHRLAVERRVFSWRRCTQMRLKRNVAEILEGENAQLIRVAEHSRGRERHPLQQLG